MEHFETIAYIVTAIITLVGGWFTMKMKNEQNTREIDELKKDFESDLKEHQVIANKLFERIDEQRESIQELKTKSTHFLTLKDMRGEHPTKGEFEQLKDTFKTMNDQIDKIYHLLFSESHKICGVNLNKSKQ